MSKQNIDNPLESRMAVKKRNRAGKILNAAFECFQENGFKNTTLWP
jgi:AcrR family transcriptional regulator